MKKKILLADDDADQLFLTQRILAKRGYEVLTAMSGRTALDIFSRKKTDIFVVVLDILMRGADGRHLAAKMKSVAPDTPIIFFSNYGFTGRVKEWGVDGIELVMKGDEKRLMALIREYDK